MKPSKRRPKRQKLWTLKRVIAECRIAPAVWMALCDMADERGSIVVTPTRELLSKVTGIRRLPTLSRALTVLHNAGWLIRTLVPAGDITARKTLIRITLCRIERKTFHTVGGAVSNEKRSTSRERKTCADSSFRRGGRPSTPPLSADAGGEAGAPATGTPADTAPETPTEPTAGERIRRKEAEAMAKARVERESAERAITTQQQTPEANTLLR